MTEIEKAFFENEVHLAKSFSLEKLGRQLNYLASCSKSFSNPPPEAIQKKANTLYWHLVKFGYQNSQIENTLVSYESRQLINEFILTYH
ncbi:MAG: hypothetical protein L6Q33_00425 [Bacteriovoracaceae bacterium]|nr:hypothetical protein [Bacteriovoracaceae bacterium]